MKRIVFVDDEPELLDGLRARLYRHRAEWQMTFVTSGKAAIAEFEAGHVDLIVSDIRMPAMDGTELLGIVRQRWPDAARIVLSGYVDQAQTLRLTSLAHQYVAKPCDAQQLENIIERCFHLQDLLAQESLRNTVGRIGKLPAMPKTSARLQQALATPDVTTEEIGSIVSADPAIATKVLQIANSAFFRSRRPLVRVRDAVTYLGFSTIRNLVLSAEVFSQWSRPANLPQLDTEALQEHSLLMAAACAALAVKGISASEAWLAGLLHDIGYWILVQECPEALASALEKSRTEGLPLYESERQIIGASHAQIGAYLLGLWGLPYTVVEAVALHHTPRSAGIHGFDLLSALAVSHAILDSAGGHPFALGFETDPGVDAEYLSGHDAPFDWDEARRRVHDSATANQQP
ncbi:MAG: response regulator [Steroidobacteraceae bacterium]|jgi:putative nucleotidyltransferase with HDIG domain